MAFRSLLLAAASACVVFAEVHSALPEVRRVYLLPMSNGLDQYLANRLTQGGRFEVVTDPSKADAVFTDRLGVQFEERWKELYPPPEGPAAAKPVAPAKGDRTTTSLEANIAPAVHISSFTRGRGNVFLVSRQSRAVVWSHFTVPKNIRAKSLDDTAERIVDRLQGDLKPKK